MKRSPLIAVALIAAACHEVNRRYCQGLGDESQEPWELAEDWQRESATKGVEAILDGTIAKPSDSHDYWLLHKEAEGWKYGPVKDPEAKEHPCMVPYDQLPIDQQRKDALFFGTVVNLSTEIVDG